MRSRTLGLALVAITISACSRPPAAPPSEVWEVTEDLRVTELRPGVWLHTSWHVLASGVRFPSNGLLVREGEGLLLIDTAWGEAPTEALLDWAAAALGLPVTQAFVTHWHDDRMGGASILEARGIPFYASPTTQRLAAEAGLPSPQTLDISEPGETQPLGPVEVLYPGPGHTLGNTVVWLPEHRIVVGGCAVKSAAAQDMGYTADADLDAWPDAIRRIQARYSAASLVVPGHGQPGTVDLLTHTLDLLAQ